MKCPFCQHPNTQVADSRWLEDTNSIRRRRKCLECGQRFSTFETVALIEQRLYRLGKKEVASHIVGEMAMEELAKIDQVAYVRFASVYKSFKDVSEFTQVIAECKAK